MKTTSELSTPSSVLAGEMQALGGDILVDEFFEARLVDRNLARRKHVDLALVVINTNDIVADLGETSAADKTNIPGTNNADFHR